MEKIIEIVKWPGVVLIIALVAIFVFKKQFAALIQRTKRIEKIGLETYEIQPSQPGNEKKAIDEFFRAFDNPLLLEAEDLILKDLKDRKIESTLDREKALVRSLASKNIILHFERAYGLLWARQHALLQFLNARDRGADINELAMFYESGKKDFPDLYESYPFDRWLGFLQSFNLITKQDSYIVISVTGREFLKYLVATGKPSPAYG